MALLPERLGSTDIELRRWHVDHAERSLRAALASFDELHQWMPWAASPPTMADMRETMASGHAAFEADAEWPYVLWETASDEVVGGAGLHRRAGPDALEIGYWVRSDRTGRGYATQAARALTDAAFRFLPDIRRIEIHMDQANRASASIPPKLGYRLLREDEREIVTPSHTGRGYVWEMHRSAWEGRADTR